MPLLTVCSKNGLQIWDHAFCGILNNAIEHSNADSISVTVSSNKLYAEITVKDDGIGIFINIREHYNTVKYEELSLKEAELDYSGIDEPGQGFAHELYVVWQKQHPNIILKNENLSENTAFMINHVKKTAGI